MHADGRAKGHFSFWLFFGPKPAKSRSRLLFSAPKDAKSAPRAIQKAYWRLQRRGLNSDPVLDPVLASKKDPGTSKIIEIQLKKKVFKEIMFLSWSCFGTSFWHPFGSRFGRLLAPKMAETSLEIPLGAPKSRSPVLFFGSKRE